MFGSFCHLQSAESRERNSEEKAQKLGEEVEIYILSLHCISPYLILYQLKRFQELVEFVPQPHKVTPCPTL